MFWVIFGVILILIAVGLFITYPVQIAQNKRRTGECEAWVTELRTRRQRRGVTYFADLTYEVDGQTTQLKNVRCPILPKDNRCTVRFNPSKPKDAHVAEFRSDPKYILYAALICLGVGLVMLVGGSVSLK